MNDNKGWTALHALLHYNPQIYNRMNKYSFNIYNNLLHKRNSEGKLPIELVATSSKFKMVNLINGRLLDLCDND